jgi:hypothetical protein
VGLFLGSVLVATVSGARWHLWPNKHPVVRLADGRDYDVVALVDDRLRTGTPTLPTVLAAARDASM